MRTVPGYLREVLVSKTQDLRLEKERDKRAKFESVEDKALSISTMGTAATAKADPSPGYLDLAAMVTLALRWEPCLKGH